tara:strand:- start:43 stop:477 length:435 start_codon:yes stop_codon:yes gene_type:complete
MNQRLLEKLEQMISQVIQTDFKVSPQSWSVKEVLGHLLDSASNNHQRFVRTKPGEMGRFTEYEPDRFVQQAFYQNYDFRALSRLVMEYTRLLAHITENFDYSILKSEVLILDKGLFNIQFLIEDYDRHFEVHVGQIERIIRAAA